MIGGMKRVGLMKILMNGSDVASVAALFFFAEVKNGASISHGFENTCPVRMPVKPANMHPSFF